VSRRLYLLRHAKSSWDHPGLPDHDRPLAKRGRRATKALRPYLQEHEIAVVGGKEEALAAPLGASEATSLDRVQRRFERLQRGDVGRAGSRDREHRHRVVQLAPPCLHLRKLGHVRKVPG